LVRARTTHPTPPPRADAGRAAAEGHFSLREMANRYDALLQELMGGTRS
jgi:hypothetical protein